MKRILALAMPALLLAVPAFAEDAAPAATGTAGAVAATAATAAATAAAALPKIDSGDTAWMLTSTALVLMMTIPGLALFYGGMVRKKNILATVMQSFAVCCLVTITWMVVGYSLAFSNGTGATAPYIGDLSRLFLNGIADHITKGNDIGFTLGAGTSNSTVFTIPETVYMMFQMTFAIITPALIAGAFADRMKFSAMCLFMVSWSLLVYCPIAHMVWSPLGIVGTTLGAIDFAGGTVVHINAGVAGLVCAIVLGKRVGYGHDNMSPYNLTYAVIGASLLWVGWFGFNAGSAGAANGRAGMAMAVTQIATGAAALAWMFAEWVTKGKPSVLGIISGAVAGLVAITPASGYVLPGPSLIIGVAAGVICFYSATGLKHMLGYDDSLDTWGVHGIGGIVGALLTGVFAYGPLSATDSNAAGSVGGMDQFISQCEAVAITLVWSGVVSFILLKIIDVVVGLRVSSDQEMEGLDVVLHGERLG